MATTRAYLADIGSKHLVTTIDTLDYASAIVADVRFEHARDALGIGEFCPRL